MAALVFSSDFLNKENERGLFESEVHGDSLLKQVVPVVRVTIVDLVPVLVVPDNNTDYSNDGND